MSFDLPPSSASSSSQTLALPSSQANNTNSMAATLPQINFGFEELKNRMVRFTVRFDDFVEKGRRRILEERNQFAKTIVEDKGDSGNKPVFGCGSNRRVDTQRMLKKEIEHYRQKEKDVAESKFQQSSVPFDIPR